LKLCCLAISLQVHKELDEMLNAKDAPCCLSFFSSCCEKTKKRIKDKVGGCLVPKNWGVAIREAALKDFLKGNRTASPNQLRVLFEESVDRLLNSLNSSYEGRWLVQWVL